MVKSQRNDAENHKLIERAKNIGIYEITKQNNGMRKIIFS